jgi:hypothetical protein
MLSTKTFGFPKFRGRLPEYSCGANFNQVVCHYLVYQTLLRCGTADPAVISSTDKKTKMGKSVGPVASSIREGPKDPELHTFSHQSTSELCNKASRCVTHR